MKYVLVSATSFVAGVWTTNLFAKKILIPYGAQKFAEIIESALDDVNTKRLIEEMQVATFRMKMERKL